MTALYGIFGHPVAHSRSPHMHNAAFAALSIDALYVPLPVPPEGLAAAIDSARALPLQGFNVTLPHKSAVMALLDTVHPDALAIGAVNTVVREGDALIGLNTDAEGLAESLRQAQVALAGARITIVGAGGAARAAVVGVAAQAATITVAARRLEQAQALCAALTPHVACALEACDMGAALTRALAQTDLLIQASSATLGGGRAAEAFAAALPLAALPDHASVCDLVYQPLRTSVLSAADRRGLRTVDGLGMLLHQGALAFTRWTGRPAPLEVMRAALNT